MGLDTYIGHMTHLKKWSFTTGPPILGNHDRGIGTRAFLPFLALVRRLLGRFRFALLVGADAFDCFQQSQKRAHVHRHHALLVHILLVLPLERAHTQHMAP